MECDGLRMKKQVMRIVDEEFVVDDVLDEACETGLSEVDKEMFELEITRFTENKSE